MYILDDRLTKRINEIAEKAALLSASRLALEEYIALPRFGYIVLRFTIDLEEYTLDDLDRYECLLYEITGDEFLTDFMGSVYRKAGADYAGLEKRLLRLNSILPDEAVTPSIHSAGIQSDALFLLRAAGLDPNRRVWEIQTEENGFILLLMGNENRPVAEIPEPVRITVREVSEAACTGLMKAVIYCRRNRISLARLLISS